MIFSHAFQEIEKEWPHRSLKAMSQIWRGKNENKYKSKPRRKEAKSRQRATTKLGPWKAVVRPCTTKRRWSTVWITYLQRQSPASIHYTPKSGAFVIGMLNETGC